MIGTKHLLTAWLVVGPFAVLRAQEGSIDVTFNTTDIGFGNGDGANSTVYSSPIQPDGKIMIGGAFTSYNGTGRNRITRLNADGSSDTGFDPGTGADDYLLSTAVQADGKIIIGGNFSIYNGTVRGRIARLNGDGTLDTAFDPGTGANGVIYSTTLQSDGKIIIGGNFTYYNGTARNHIARLNADGSLDTGFNPGTGANNLINCTTFQPDGKILIGGDFTSYNGTARNCIARLNADGSSDTGFNPGTGANNYINTITLQPDGKVVIGGNFTSYNSTARNRIARLNADGTLDTAFNPGTGVNNYIHSITIQPDGKIIIGGYFTNCNGTARNRIARLNANGSLDTGFNPGSGSNSHIRYTTLQPDGRIIIGGQFTNYDGTGRNYIARLNADGTQDPGFNPGTGANNFVSSTAIQADGKIIIGGAFTRYNGTGCNRIARLNANGSVDTGFNTGGIGPNNEVRSTALQADGKVIIGGIFTNYNGTGRNFIARLNADGSLDTGFNPGPGANGDVRSITIQTDGKIIIGGFFTSYNGTGRNYIARLNADGSLDTGYDPGTGASHPVHSTAILTDGKIIIGGVFTSYNGTGRNRIARLNADGSLDTGFDPGAGASGEVRSIAILSDGKIIIGGWFTSYNGTGRNRIARLNADGSLDTGFDPGTGASNVVYSTATQADGKTMISGDFDSYNGIGRNNIARLKTDGSLDTDFNPGTGANDWVISTAIQADGKIIICGYFTSYNGTGRNRIARINGTARTAIKVMLEGPYNGGLMNDALRTLPSFPLTEPFTAMGYAEAAFVPGATIPASLLSVTGNNAIVDWVIVEMRPVATPNVVAASRAVLLQRDGDVVDLDGVSTVGFAGLAAGSYCVAVKPRTHLPVMLSTSTPIIYGDAIASVDFTLPSTQLYDTDAQNNIGGVMVLATGDAVFNENLQYTGVSNDRDPILIRIGGTVATATVNGYWNEDVNMDGIVKYTGANNDRDPILLNVGGSTPTVVRHAELP